MGKLVFITYLSLKVVGYLAWDYLLMSHNDIQFCPSPDTAKYCSKPQIFPMQIITNEDKSARNQEGRVAGPASHIAPKPARLARPTRLQF